MAWIKERYEAWGGMESQKALARRALRMAQEGVPLKTQEGVEMRVPLGYGEAKNLKPGMILEVCDTFQKYKVRVVSVTEQETNPVLPDLDPIPSVAVSVKPVDPAAAPSNNVLVTAYFYQCIHPSNQSLFWPEAYPGAKEPEDPFDLPDPIGAKEANRLSSGDIILHREGTASIPPEPPTFTEMIVRSVERHFDDEGPRIAVDCVKMDHSQPGSTWMTGYFYPGKGGGCRDFFLPEKSDSYEYQAGYECRGCEHLSNADCPQVCPRAEFPQYPEPCVAPEPVPFVAVGEVEKGPVCEPAQVQYPDTYTERDWEATKDGAIPLAEQDPIGAYVPLLKDRFPKPSPYPPLVKKPSFCWTCGHDRGCMHPVKED